MCDSTTVNVHCGPKTPIISRCTCNSALSLPIPAIIEGVPSVPVVSFEYPHNGINYKTLTECKRARIRSYLEMCAITPDDIDKLVDILPHMAHLLLQDPINAVSIHVTTDKKTFSTAVDGLNHQRTIDQKRLQKEAEIKAICETFVNSLSKLNS